jgi:5-methylthioadenosine/S-adenosylhomocysteine deaminase
MSGILIEGGLVLTMAPNEPPRRADVLVERDRIAAVGAPAADEGVTVIDARGCLVMPGLVNAHTHSPLTLMRSTSDDLGAPGPSRISSMPRGQDWRGRLSPEEHQCATRLAIAEMIRSGTTTFVDMFEGMDQVARAVIDMGVRAALGWEITTFRNDPVRWLPYDDRTARRTFESAGKFAADWHGAGDGRVTALIAPHEVGTCHEPWLTRAVRLADELKLDITMHVAESAWEAEFCQERYGVRPVEVMRRAGVLAHRVIGAHCAVVDHSDLKTLATGRFSAVACLGSYLKLATAVTPVPSLLDAGINVALGTDSAGTNNNLNLWDEIHLNATLHGFLACDAGLVPGDAALRMATIGGAVALGREEDLGTVETGKKADLIVVDLRRPHLYPQEGAALIGNLIYSATGGEVRDVLVDGQVLMRDGQIISFDEGAVLDEAEAIVRRRRAQVHLPHHYDRP